MKDMLANTQVQVILENQNKMMKTNGDLAFHVNKCRMPLREYQKIEWKQLLKKALSVVDTKIDDAIRESQEQEARKLNFIMVNVSENPG